MPGRGRDRSPPGEHAGPGTAPLEQVAQLDRDATPGAAVGDRRHSPGNGDLRVAIGAHAELDVGDAYDVTYRVRSPAEGEVDMAVDKARQEGRRRRVHDPHLAARAGHPAVDRRPVTSPIVPLDDHGDVLDKAPAGQQRHAGPHREDAAGLRGQAAEAAPWPSRLAVRVHLRRSFRGRAELLVSSKEVRRQPDLVELARRELHMPPAVDEREGQMARQQGGEVVVEQRVHRLRILLDARITDILQDDLAAPKDVVAAEQVAAGTSGHEKADVAPAMAGRVDGGKVKRPALKLWPPTSSRSTSHGSRSNSEG